MFVSETDILSARILTVDDNPVNVALLRDMLEAEGFTQIVGTTSPYEALELLAKDPFDLLLLDIRMPGMDGHQVLARLPETSKNYVPVIVLTAQTDPETRMRALSGGARDFISKPFDTTEATQRIRNALEAQLLYAQHRDHAVMLEQEVQKRTAELRYMATHHSITGLLNRAGFRAALSETLEAQASGTLTFMVIDGLGAVNDSLGHQVGEQALRAVGERLQSLTPPGGVVASWSNSEFVILHASTATVCQSDYDAAFSQPFRVDDNDLVLSYTAGSVNFPEDGADGDSLVQRAGLAMFFARQRGLQTCAFTSDLEDTARRRLQLERELRGAIERHELQVYYQPKISLSTGRVVGMEALLRWFHPELGFVSPVHFIPVAEETGAIVPIGEWVMRQACSDTRAWHLAGFEELVVAVNVSGRQFEATDLSGTVAAVLADSGLPATALEVEITETALMRDLERARTVLGALRDLGVALAIDDFGTGYSSLAYLRDLAIDTLKVDQSFVRDLTSDNDDQAIVRAILVMAQSLGLETVAEGIETPEHKDFLRAHGCTLGQGYLYAKPMPAKDFSAYLHSQR